MTHSEALERAIQIVEAYIASHTDPDPSFGTVKVAKETLVIVENLNKIIKRNERSDGVDNGK